jgi:hypothetical protein
LGLKIVHAEFDMRRAAIAMSTAFIALPALFAGVAQAQDRYGPQAAASLTPVSYAADRPMLNWPGKQPAPSDETAAPAAPPPPAPPPAASIYTPPSPPPAPPAVAQVTAPTPTVAPMAPPPVAPQASLRAPPPPTSPPMASASLDMRPLLPAQPPVAPVASHTPQPPSPQLAHAAKPKPQPAASKPPVAVAAVAPPPAPPEPAEPPHRPWSATGPGLPAHFYSTAREFGQQPDPDPVPLSSQFFADTGGTDLAAPPPPLDPRAVPGSQTVGSTASANTPANRARAIALDTPSPDGSGN